MRKAILLGSVFATIVLLLTLSVTASAQFTEEECRNCHGTRFQSAISIQKCVDCHMPVEQMTDSNHHYWAFDTMIDWYWVGYGLFSTGAEPFKDFSLGPWVTGEDEEGYPAPEYIPNTIHTAHQPTSQGCTYCHPSLGNPVSPYVDCDACHPNVAHKTHGGVTPVTLNVVSPGINTKNFTCLNAACHKPVAYGEGWHKEFSTPSCISGTCHTTTHPTAQLDTVAPTIIAGPRVHMWKTTGATAEVDWETNEKSTSYVDFGTTASYGQAVGNNDRNYGHKVELSGLINHTVYHYQVRSKDAAGNELVSGDYTFTTNNTPPKPILIGQTDLDGIAGGPYRLTWNPVTDPDGDPVQYYVRIYNDGWPGHNFNSGWITATSWDTPSLISGALYKWRVRVKDSYGAWRWSATREFRVPYPPFDWDE